MKKGSIKKIVMGLVLCTALFGGSMDVYAASSFNEAFEGGYFSDSCSKETTHTITYNGAYKTKTTNG